MMERNRDGKHLCRSVVCLLAPTACGRGQDSVWTFRVPAG
jgi:hypothetical protein